MARAACIDALVNSASCSRDAPFNITRQVVDGMATRGRLVCCVESCLMEIPRNRP